MKNKINKVPSMWEEFQSVRDRYWVELEKIDKKYKKYKMKLKYDVLGDVCGIEKASKTIHAFDLESKI